MATSVIPSLGGVPAFQSSAPRGRPNRVRARTVTDPTNADQQTAAVAQSLQGQTQAVARGAQINFQKDVGTLLGNLNAIGSIRSGGVKTGVQDIGETYGQQIGLEAAKTATEAARIGTERAQFEKSDLTNRYGIDTQAASSRYSADSSAGASRYASDMGYRASSERLASDDRRFGQDLDFRREVEGRRAGESQRDYEERVRSRESEDRYRQDDLSFRRDSSQRDYDERVRTSDRDYAEDVRRYGVDEANRRRQEEEDRRRYENERERQRRVDAADGVRYDPRDIEDYASGRRGGVGQPR